MYRQIDGEMQKAKKDKRYKTIEVVDLPKDEEQKEQLIKNYLGDKVNTTPSWLGKKYACPKCKKLTRFDSTHERTDKSKRMQEYHCDCSENHVGAYQILKTAEELAEEEAKEKEQERKRKEFINWKKK